MQLLCHYANDVDDHDNYDDVEIDEAEDYGACDDAVDRNIVAVCWHSIQSIP